MNKYLLKIGSNKYLHALFVSLSSLLLLILVFMICHITPFGDSTLMVYDAKRQYVDFYSYYQGILSGQNNLFYSPSITLGSGAVGLFTYYLSSPFMIVFAFFDKASIPTALSIMVMLKLALSAGSCDLFLNHYLADKMPKTFLFSISYSLCAYMISNSINPMWLDVYIMMPIVIWMLDRLLYKNAKNGYILSLAYMIYCNYYIAFMVCIFIVMWTFYRIFTDRMHVFRKLISVALCSLLAGLLDSVLLLPTILELAGGPKDIAKLGLHTIRRYPDFREVLSKLWFLAYDYEQPLFGTPLIYVGVTILIFTILFFTNKKIRMCEKIWIACMMIIFIISFIFNTLSLIWHGGMEPSGYPQREAFLLVFLFIICGCKCLNYFEEGIRKKSIAIAIIILLVIAAFSLTGGYFYTDNRMIISNILLVLIVSVLLCLYYVYINDKQQQRIIYFIARLSVLGFVALQICELTVNSVYIYKTLSFNESLHKDEFADIVNNNLSLMTKIESDQEFFRMENMQPREQNDSMMYHFNGVTHYSSSDSIYPRTFLSRLGYNNTHLLASYGNDNTCMADSILGIKYLMNTNGLRADYDVIYGDSGELVKNPYPLSIATAAPEKPVITESNPFAIQEEIYSNITNTEISVFEDTIVDSFASSDDYVSQTFACKTRSDGYVYFYLNGIVDKAQNLIVYLNDEQFSFYGNQNYMRILNLGYFYAGDTFEVEVRCEDLDADFGQALIKTENIDKLSAAYDIAKNRNLNISQITPSRYDIQLPEDSSSISCSGIATTIPFSSDWKVSLDGKKIDIEEIYDAFLYIPVSEDMYGKTITMTYIPKGMSIGLALTIISVICLIIINRATLSMILNHMILNIPVLRKESK